MECVESWLDQYEKEQDNLEKQAKIIEDNLSEFLKEAEINFIITSRVKKLESLKEKIYRNNYSVDKKDEKNIFQFLKDGIGIRIMCLEHNDEEKIYEQLKKIDNKTIKFNDTIKDQPEFQKNGHPIYRINGESEKYKFELQIKSLSHMLWGEIEHMLFYKNYNCIIGSSFFKYQIEQIFDDLVAINDRISNLRKYISKESIEKEFLEIKEISSMILQKKCKCYTESICDGITLDFRMLYKVIIDDYYDEFNRSISILEGKITRKRKDSKINEEDVINKIFESFEKLVGIINEIDETTLQQQIEIDVDKLGFVENSNQYKVLNALLNNKEKKTWLIFLNLTKHLMSKDDNNDYFKKLVLRLDENYELEGISDDIEKDDGEEIKESFFCNSLDELKEGNQYEYTSNNFMKEMKATNIIFFKYLIKNSNYFEDEKEKKKHKELYKLIYKMSESLVMNKKIKKDKLEGFFKSINGNVEQSKMFFYYDENDTFTLSSLENILNGE